jgi:hypothetical protein
MESNMVDESYLYAGHSRWNKLERVKAQSELDFCSYREAGDLEGMEASLQTIANAELEQAGLKNLHDRVVALETTQKPEVFSKEEKAARPWKSVHTPMLMSGPVNQNMGWITTPSCAA